jgi:serine/threonine protein kinase
MGASLALNFDELYDIYVRTFGQVRSGTKLEAKHFGVQTTMNGFKPFSTEGKACAALASDDVKLKVPMRGKLDVIERITALMGGTSPSPVGTYSMKPDLKRDMVGDWGIVKPLRRDGQGEVFLVERQGSDGYALGVLKRVPRDVAAETKRLARFKHEIQIVQELRHPFIAEVLDTNLDGEMWFVTRFAPLGSLLDNVSWFQGDAWRTLRMGRDLATALLAAHEKKVIHRDVKPGNILVYAPDHVALTDFGIAHQPDQTPVTSTHEKVGPRWFLPPEAEHGRIEPSPAHDVYMLGKLVYFALTGGKSFLREKFADGDANIESMFGRAEFAIVNKLFGKMIVEDPARRFQTMDEVVAAIDAALGHVYGRRTLDTDACRQCDVGRYEEYGVLNWNSPTDLYIGKNPRDTSHHHQPTVFVCNPCGDVQIRFKNRGETARS